MKRYLLGLIAAILAAPVAAAPITYNFTATFLSSSGTITDPTVSGLPSTVTGSFTFDDATPDARSDRSDFGSYSTGDVGLDGVDFGPVANRVTSVSDNVGSTPFDQFVVNTRFTSSLSAQIVLRDGTSSVFNSDGLGQPISLSSFGATSQFQLFERNASNVISATSRYQLTSLTPSQVPLPAGGLLLMTALGALILRPRRT